jgi:hypothetical protein
MPCGRGFGVRVLKIILSLALSFKKGEGNFFINLIFIFETKILPI